MTEYIMGKGEALPKLAKGEYHFRHSRKYHIAKQYITRHKPYLTFAKQKN